jgi:RHS repeat-associated protein
MIDVFPKSHVNRGTDRSGNTTPLKIEPSSNGSTMSNEVKWTYSGFNQPTGEYQEHDGASSGDAGDVYTGLDRFGRMVETIWQAGSTELVHTTYGRNRVGGVTWQRNVLAHAMTGSPLPPERLQQDNFYWYDGLQQNYQHQRGDLAGTAPNYTGITNLQQTEIRSFDETGNWLSNYTSSPALTQSRTHNKANEIATISGITAPTFDGTGNMKTMPKPGAWSTTCTLTWDAWNRLITCTDGTTTTNNRYDALARRIRKSITGGEVRDYYYDKRWRSIEERLSGTFSGTDKTRHVWSPFDRWTLIRRQRETAGTLTDTHFCLKDYLDPTALITPAAAVVERFSYDAFGPVRFMNAAFVTQSSSSYAWTFLFHGEFIDSESGLYNYGYRFYHPQLGRWLSRDPIEEQDGENLFLYIFNNPESRNDFLGLISNSECQEKMNKAKTTGLTNRISQEISNKKCYIEIKCICCKGETAKFGGYTELKGTITVTLCSNNLKNDSEVSTLLTHEMTHALQYCRNKDRSSSCEQRVCDELQAYTTDGSASSLPPDKKKNDIINRAAQSAQRDCGNDFET